MDGGFEDESPFCTSRSTSPAQRFRVFNDVKDPERDTEPSRGKESHAAIDKNQPSGPS